MPCIVSHVDSKSWRAHQAGSHDASQICAGVLTPFLVPSRSSCYTDYAELGAKALQQVQAV